MMGGVPSMDDARAAAAALAGSDPAIERICVFGSVAEGRAGARSDIDLLVIVADLDYSQRGSLSRKYGKTASDAAGCEVMCLVSDWAEHAARMRMATSMERDISDRMKDLYTADGISGTDEAKEVESPVSDGEETWHRLGDNAESLCSIAVTVRAGEGSYMDERAFSRAVLRCSYAAAEGALKSMMHSTLSGWPQKHGDLRERCAALGDSGAAREATAAVERLLGCDWAMCGTDLSSGHWRPVGPRIDQLPEPVSCASAERARLWAEAAVELTEIAVRAAESATLSGDRVRELRESVMAAVGEAKGALESWAG